MTGALTRRALFGGMLRPLLRLVPARPRLFPPGAAENFTALCDACSACVDACPHKALFLSGGLAGLDPARSPCRLCADMPCIPACDRGALLPGRIRMGTAEIRRDACLESCRACVDACPLPGALSWGEEGPGIDAERCVGCGICEHVCGTVNPPGAAWIRPPGKEEEAAWS